MGLRSPQDMQKVELRPEATSRLQAGGAPQISKEFVGALEQAATDREKERERLRIKRTSLIKDALDNDADTEIIRATATVANSEGANALDSARKQREVLKKALENRFSKLSPEYQAEFAGTVDSHLAKYDQTVIPHTYRESKKLEDTIKKERIVNDRNDAILMSGDIETFDKVGLNKVYSKATEYAQLKYGQDLEADVPNMPGVKVKELVQTTAKAAVSETISGAAQEQAMSGNIQGAKALMEKFDLEMSSGDKAKALKVISRQQNRNDNGQAMTLVEEALKAHPDDLAMQEQYIRGSAGTDIKLYKSALEVARFRNTINQKQKTQQEKKALADVNTAIIDGKFDVQMINDLAPEKQAATLRFATEWNQKKFIPTNDKTFKELDDMILNSPSDYAEEDLMSYRSQLNDRDFRSLKMAQDRIRSEYRSQEKRIASNPDKIIAGIRKEYIQNKGLEGSEGEIYKISREFVEEELARNPKITPAELRKKYAASLYERGVKKEKNPAYNWFSPIKNALPLLGETPEKIDVPAESIIAPEKKPAVHPDNIKKLKKMRPDLSESQILEYLNKKKQEGIDISIPI